VGNSLQWSFELASGKGPGCLQTLTFATRLKCLSFPSLSPAKLFELVKRRLSTEKYTLYNHHEWGIGHGHKCQLATWTTHKPPSLSLAQAFLAYVRPLIYSRGTIVRTSSSSRRAEAREAPGETTNTQAAAVMVRQCYCFGGWHGLGSSQTNNSAVWSHLYSFSFEQNSDWTREYPGQEEILVSSRCRFSAHHADFSEAIYHWHSTKIRALSLYMI
jgi:hypothetical protein